jgi:hypothetical protein
MENTSMKLERLWNDAKENPKSTIHQMLSKTENKEYWKIKLSYLCGVNDCHHDNVEKKYLTEMEGKK